jgi:hypothetical protein
MAYTRVLFTSGQATGAYRPLLQHHARGENDASYYGVVKEKEAAFE